MISHQGSRLGSLVIGLILTTAQWAQGQLSFSNHPTSIEDVNGASAFLSGFPSPFSPDLSFQWLKDGVPVDGATQSSLQITVSPDTAGIYVLTVTDGVATAESQPATVAVATLSPAPTDFIKIVNTTDEIPGLAPRKFSSLRDGRLRNGVLTVTGTDSFESAGGVFRYADGIGTAIVLETSALPGFTGIPTFFGGKTVLGAGVVHLFVTSNPDRDAVLDEFAVLQSQDGVISVVADEQTEIPTKEPALFEGLGWPYRGMGKTAFLGRGLQADLPDTVGYRAAFVLAEDGLEVWADNESPLPAGDGVWNGNSAQVGFDGETLAFWATDRTQSDGIFVTKAAGPLEKVAFKGDPIPGTAAQFEGFISPPVVAQGRLLFVGRTSDFSQNYLVEWTENGLEVLAHSGAPVSGGGLGLGRIAHGFEPANDGSVLFTSHGPGPKQGIYRLQNGTIEPIITTLNSIDGVRLQGVSLRDVDGDALLAELRFEDGVSGYYATDLELGPAPEPPLTPEPSPDPNPAPATPPVIEIAINAGVITLSWNGDGVLESTSDFVEWVTEPGGSPRVIDPTDAHRFFRIRVP